MTVYLSGMLRVRNTAWQTEYQQRLPAVLKRYGGEILAAGAPAAFEGGAPLPDRLIIFRFPSMEAARAWYQDPEHGPLVQLRQSGADLDLIGVEAPQA